MKLKHIVTIICLTISGCVSLYYGEVALAGACFGAIGGWGLVNGVKEAAK